MFLDGGEGGDIRTSIVPPAIVGGNSRGQGGIVWEEGMEGVVPAKSGKKWGAEDMASGLKYEERHIFT